MFDNTRLRAELHHIQRTLEGVAAGARGKVLVGEPAVLPAHERHQLGVLVDETIDREQQVASLQVLD